MEAQGTPHLWGQREVTDADWNGGNSREARCVLQDVVEASP